MSAPRAEQPLQPGDVAPNVVLDAITRQGKVAFDDYRGQRPVLVGLFRGLHCPFCRRQIAAMSQLEPALREKGVATLTVVNTPLERARLYFRYRPMPNLLAAADPERLSHRAFGLPNLAFTEAESEWPHKVAIQEMIAMKINPTGELPEPLNPIEAAEALNKKDGYEITGDDQQMITSGQGQLVGEFLLDRQGIIRWSFTEVPEGGRHLFGAPSDAEVMSAASQLAT
jgi:peroxiredoxin